MARNVKARYRTVGPKLVMRETNQCSIDAETKSLQQEKVMVEAEMYMVYFPQGHSTRMTLDELKFHGYDKKPQLIDLETGEVVEFGGDPYDFAKDPDQQERDAEHITLEDLQADEAQASGRKKAS